MGSAGLALIAELIVLIEFYDIKYDACFGVQVASTAGTVGAAPFVSATGILGYIGWFISAVTAIVAFACG